MLRQYRHVVLIEQRRSGLDEVKEAIDGLLFMYHEPLFVVELVPQHVNLVEVEFHVLDADLLEVAVGAIEELQLLVAEVSANRGAEADHCQRLLEPQVESVIEQYLIGLVYHQDGVL